MMPRPRNNISDLFRGPLVLVLILVLTLVDGDIDRYTDELEDRAQFLPVTITRVEVDQFVDVPLVEELLGEVDEVDGGVDAGGGDVDVAAGEEREGCNWWYSVEWCGQYVLCERECEYEREVGERV